MIGTFFKGMSPASISQGFHFNHKAWDLVPPTTVYFGYGTPLCTPEDCLVLGINGDGFTPDSHKNFLSGYGIRLKGLKTGYEYLLWHCLPIFPVWGGDKVKEGQIVAYMGNSGTVYSNGKFVELEDRDQLPINPKDPEEDGLHLHAEVYDKGMQIDPLPLIDFSKQPTYTTLDFMKAYIKILEKQVKLYTR